MDRAEFMRRLTELLQNVPTAEREEAIQYYSDYLDDAGMENEDAVLASLGTPEELADIIKAGLSDGGNGGEFTESGFQGYCAAPRNEVANTPGREDTSGQSPYGKASYEKNPYGQASPYGQANPYGQAPYEGNPYGQPRRESEGRGGRKKPMSGGMLALLVIALILSSPLWLGLAGGLFGLAVGVLAALLGIWAALLAVGVALAAAGIAFFLVGIGMVFSLPLGGLCMAGGGMICFAVGLAFIWITVMLIAVLVPGLIRGIVNLAGRLFHRGGVKA